MTQIRYYKFQVVCFDLQGLLLLFLQGLLLLCILCLSNVTTSEFYVFFPLLPMIVFIGEKIVYRGYSAYNEEEKYICSFITLEVASC